jgi:hypothetical protein
LGKDLLLGEKHVGQALAHAKAHALRQAAEGVVDGAGRGCTPTSIANANSQEVPQVKIVSGLLPRAQ